VSNKTESIHVTMHVVSRKNADDLDTDKQIQSKVDALVSRLMDPVRNGRQLAERLSLPADVPIQWNVKVAAVNDGFRAPQGEVPVMISVGGVPGIMEKLRPQIAEEITNLIFNEIRKETIEAKELATAIGYQTGEAAKFHFYLPQLLKSQSPAQTAMYGDGDVGGDTGGDIGDFGGGGGWAKGCHNWPW
jgi:hypothetical protein